MRTSSSHGMPEKDGRGTAKRGLTSRSGFSPLVAEALNECLSFPKFPFIFYKVRLKRVPASLVLCGLVHRRLSISHLDSVVGISFSALWRAGHGVSSLCPAD